MRWLATLMLLSFGFVLSAGEAVRTWTDLKGRTMEASFIKYSGDKIVIKRKDGRVFMVSPALFSARDQKYLADLKKAVEAPNQTNAQSSADGKDQYFKGAIIVVFVQGEVSIDDPAKAKADSDPVLLAKEGDILSVGSQIKVGANSELILLFSNGTITSLGANTQMFVRTFIQKNFDGPDKKVADLQEEVSSSTLSLDLQIGDMVVDVKKLKKESNFAITSPLGTAGIRGTQFKLVSLEDSTKLSVLNGIVDFSTPGKKPLKVDASKGVLADKGKELVINDLGDAEKQSIIHTLAKGREEAKEISLSTMRDKLGKSFKTHVVPSVGNLEMIWVEPGTFTMGSPTTETGRDADPEDEHSVTLTNGFYLGKYEVTQAQYEVVTRNSVKLNSKPSKSSDNPNRPVENVSLEEAVGFCKRLTIIERRAKRLPEGWKYVLPTEAQWEYACRAGTKTAFSFGDSLTSDQANINGGPGETTDVGQYAPNPWGFFDMHGNVNEWTADWYAASYPTGSVTDPVGPTTGSYRVERGGSWGSSASNARSANRSGRGPAGSFSTLGFRLSLRPASK
jgi:formylglycine-generating enzyme required for sulfatase activity